MINSSRTIEKFLQNYRFRLVKPYLVGDVLDFGGNKGELKKLIKGQYTVVNYDHSAMENKNFDTIVALAVIEHINVQDVYSIFNKFKAKLRSNGRILITTPTKMAKPLLDFMSFIGIVDKENIAEHKHYWNKKEIYDLAQKTGFVVKDYRKFQIVFNQLVILEHG